MNKNQKIDSNILKMNKAGTIKRNAQSDSWIKIGENLERDLFGQGN